MERWLHGGLRMVVRVASLLLVVGVLVLLGAPATVVAQAPAAAPRDFSSQLGDPRLRRLPAVQLADPGELELSQRSMGGPGAEVLMGGALVIATPVVTSLISLAAGPPLFECTELWGDGTDRTRFENPRVGSSILSLGTARLLKNPASAGFFAFWACLDGLQGFHSFQGFHGLWQK